MEPSKSIDLQPHSADQKDLESVVEFGKTYLGSFCGNVRQLAKILTKKFNNQLSNF